MIVIPLMPSLCGAHRVPDAPLPPVRRPAAVIGHRGGAAIAPENTLAAYRQAIRLGADYVEIDVRTTSDGALVIMHDRTVDRTTDGKGAVRDLTLAQIRSLAVVNRFGPRSAKPRVPTLDEVLRVCRGKIGIYLDHKEADTRMVLAALRKHKVDRGVIVYSGTEGVKEWKRLAPEIPVMPSLPDEYRRPGGIAEYRKQTGAEVLDGHMAEWTADLVRQAHDAGAKVYVDIMGPTDNDDGYRRAIEIGVDGIQTDHPDKLIAFLKRAGK